MTRTIFSSCFGLLALALALPAHAATITLSPASVSVKTGQTVTVTVAVDPGSATPYTIKSVISFPADLLSVSSFSFANGWIPLSASGYDSTDNVAGALVKTAGYPGGVRSSTPFGVITFTAKKSGVATVAVSSGAVAYDAQNANTLSGAQGSATVTIASLAATPAPEPAVTKTPAQTTSSSNRAVPSTVSEEATSSDAVATTSATSSEEQVAAVAGTSAAGVWWWALALVAVIGGGAWWFVRKA